LEGLVEEAEDVCSRRQSAACYPAIF
jgi:hypothetical protein